MTAPKAAMPSSEYTSAISRVWRASSEQSLNSHAILFKSSSRAEGGRGSYDEVVDRRWAGSLWSVVSTLALGAVMLPLRSHLSVSTAALVLVIPVVIGAVVGGFRAGVVGVVAGFVVYDYEFIPPYRTLNVGSAQNWVALGVYVVVMLLVTRVVASLDAARAEAQGNAAVTRRLFELSELLVGDQPVEALLATVVRAVQSVFALPGVTLLILDDGQLSVAAHAGEPLDDEELRRLDPRSGQPVGLSAGSRGVAGGSGVRTVALSTAGRAVGMLALRGEPLAVGERHALSVFANDAALAIERAQLRDQARRTALLEEVDHLRRNLIGAVSHDLQTPLATIKVASSTFVERAATLSIEDARELHDLIGLETDRLSRLVSNLLDMTRIEAGVMTTRTSPTSVDHLVRSAIDALGTALAEHRVVVHLDPTLPLVDVDPVLIEQVLVNLLDNAVRHVPAGSVLDVAAERREGEVAVMVSDQGPGIAPADRERIFDRFTQFDTGGRAGLGLTIARTFVEAHGQRLWYEDAPAGGARFVFTLTPVPGEE